MRRRRLQHEESEFVKEHLRLLRLFLQGIREARRLTQEDVSLVGTMDNKTVGRVERGDAEPSYSTLLLISRGLGLSPACLLRMLADYVEHGHDSGITVWCEGTYYAKNGSEWVEIWRGKGKGRRPHTRERESPKPGIERRRVKK